jgi:hypothetical protein
MKIFGPERGPGERGLPRRQWEPVAKDRVVGYSGAPKGTSELIREGVKNAVGCGMDGITRGHYDGAEFPILLAIRVCLDAKDVHRPAKLLLA